MMRKTADLTVVQRTLVDTQEDKPQKVIAKRTGCSQSAVLKHNHGKFTGIEKFGGKGARAVELRGLSSKANSRTLELH